jgi:hypothetical protein
MPLARRGFPVFKRRLEAAAQAIAASDITGGIGCNLLIIKDQKVVKN